VAGGVPRPGGVWRQLDPGGAPGPATRRARLAGAPRAAGGLAST
jgi:hypothetical protein